MHMIIIVKHNHKTCNIKLTLQLSTFDEKPINQTLSNQFHNIIKHNNVRAIISIQ